MSPLRSALADYLTVRRALGHKLKQVEALLTQFIAYLEERGAETITIEAALAWATSPGGARAWHYMRLSAVRGFAAYLKTIDPACEVPPAELIRAGNRRATPYIYSQRELADLLEATDTMRTPHLAATYRTLIGLLAVTGMRIGEAIRLDHSDVDFKTELILVRDTKFGKTRELPLHPSTVAALRRYQSRRDRPRWTGGTEAFFVSTKGSRLNYNTVQRGFRRLRKAAGITARSAKCRPRTHDLRHSFAVHTILDAYRDGGEIKGRLAALSTYLGHVDPVSTYWYLSGAPELMEMAARRLERHLGDRS
jgi:integrase